VSYLAFGWIIPQDFRLSAVLGFRAPVLNYIDPLLVCVSGIFRGLQVVRETPLS